MTFLLCAVSFVAGGAAVGALWKYRDWQQEGRSMVLHFSNALQREQEKAAKRGWRK